MINPGYVDENDSSAVIRKSYLNTPQKLNVENSFENSTPIQLIRENGQPLSQEQKVQEIQPNLKEGKGWNSFTRREKLTYLIGSMLKIILFVVLLYLFLLSLNFMTIGFTMVAGYTIKGGPIIRYVLSNPFAALTIGIIATAIMQNAT